MFKKTLIPMLLALGLFSNASAGCNSAGRWASGLIKKIYVASNGVVQVRIGGPNNGNLPAPCDQSFNLSATIVGSHRFDLMYTVLLTASSNGLAAYFEWDANRNITAAEVNSPLEPIP